MFYFTCMFCLISAANFCCNKNLCLSNKFLQQISAEICWIAAIQISAAIQQVSAQNFCNTNCCSKFVGSLQYKFLPQSNKFLQYKFLQQILLQCNKFLGKKFLQQISTAYFCCTQSQLIAHSTQ